VLPLGILVLALSRESDESGKRDGKRWEEMGRDGKRWEEMGRDGKRWEEMGRDGKRWEEIGAKDDAGSKIEDRGLKDWWNKIQGDKR
jgi:hypothetical protein